MSTLRSKSGGGALVSALPLAIQALVRLGSSFLTVKFVTICLAPSQFIVYGQIQTLMQIYSAFTASVGSTKLAAVVARKDRQEEKSEVLDTSIFLVVGLAFILFVGTAIFNESIQRYIGIFDSASAVLLLPLGALAVAYTAIVQAYYTGSGDAYRFSKSSILSVSIIGLSTVAMTAYFGQAGALLSIGISPIVAAVVIGVFDKALKLPRPGNVRLKMGLELSGFTISSIISLVGYYFAQLYIRSNYVQEVSAHEAGLLVAAARISDVYMGIVSVFCANFLTKAYASVKHSQRTLSLVRFYLYFSLICLPAFLVLAIWADVLIPIILSRKYVEAVGHLKMQICGDILKCFYWISIYYVIGRFSTKTYFSIEIFGLAIYLLMAVVNPFNSIRYAPQVAQIVEYAVLIMTVNLTIALKKND
ncbi:oligosaccharide flippase family protein [Massilia kyonggiensis]|nr:oligosaccharide flippase family protein [Massilia kyonggiensis]